MKIDTRIIEKLDYALSLIIGTEKVDKIYELKTEKQIENYIFKILNNKLK